MAEPQRQPLVITAAWPRWPWSDLASALVPNGRFLDTGVAPFGTEPRPGRDRAPELCSGLYALGKSAGYYCGDSPASSPCTNPDADLNRDFALLAAGEPPSDAAKAALAEIFAHHQAYGRRHRLAPLLIENGWTDDLFPPEHALRVYNQ